MAPPENPGVYARDQKNVIVVEMLDTGVRESGARQGGPELLLL